MKIVAHTVHPDEPCWGYFTGPKVRPGWGEEQNPRMIEQVFVIRGDAIACYEQDFGPADDWPYVPPMMMPSYGENPVGLMQWHGERHRHDDKWAKRMEEYKQSSTLFEDALRQDQQMSEIVHNRSNIGPGGNFQRNGWSSDTVRRNYVDKRNEKTKRIKNL